MNDRLTLAILATIALVVLTLLAPHILAWLGKERS